MLTKHFHLTQVCILQVPFVNIERGNGDADSYSVGIMMMISCFWHYPPQFAYGCRINVDVKIWHVAVTSILHSLECLMYMHISQTHL